MSFLHPKLLYAFFTLTFSFVMMTGYSQHCTPGFHFTVEGYTVMFDDHSTADGDITNYGWDFGDGQTSDEQNPDHTYTHSGTYNVCLTITAHNPGCTATFCHHVVIHDPPPGNCHATFTAHQPDLNEQLIDFTDGSTSDGNIITWAWDFGDGNVSTLQNPSHIYQGHGTYLVCLHITDDSGCTSHFCHDVVVHHPPAGDCHALFSAHQPDLNEPVIEFTDLSTSDGTITYWSWDFANGPLSVQQNPTVIFPGPGTYLVCLYIEDDAGCTSHYCHEVVVHHPPAGVCHALYTAHLPDSSEVSFNFTDLSTSDGNITSWLWSFGDGTSSTEQNPNHTFQTPGIYLVCLYITDDTGCTSHYCHEIIVHHPPAGICHALFAAHQPNQNELTILFTDLSSGDGIISEWYWDFGDSTTSAEQNPAHTYNHPGTYLVCLFITDHDGCTSHYCHHVTLHPIPADVDNSAQMVGLDHSHSASKINTADLPTASIFHPVPSSLTNEMNQPDREKHETYISIYPNPIVGESTIKYDLATDADVRLEIYNLAGQILIQTDRRREGKGLNIRTLHAEDLQAGTYYVRLVVGDSVITKKVIVLN